MIEMKDFLEGSREKNIIVQRALRDVDTDLLAAALLDMAEEEREIVYRNMSKRAHALILEDVKAKDGTTSMHAIAEAKEFFLQLLRRYSKYAEEGISFPEEGDLPDIDTTKDQAITETFYELARYLRRFGPLSLEKLEERAAHPIMEKGLELMIDGWDPILVRSVLERYGEAYVADVRKKTQMIIDGMSSLMDGDVPEVVREKLLAFLQTS